MVIVEYWSQVDQTACTNPLDGHHDFLLSTWWLSISQDNFKHDHQTPHLKRHSLVLIKVENLKWYGPRITFCISVSYFERICQAVTVCAVVFKVWIWMLTFWMMLELPIQQRRSQCREVRRRWGIGACLVPLPDQMIVITVVITMIIWWFNCGPPSLWEWGHCRF